ncbi:putative serine protease PepD [Actinomadura hallensis]|uniref:Putative serine protease PepD n=1 Tax=Actinomadura hallensis TaxID=337895 RepID=A0A543IDL2_9ACTN|nr:trypsin-like peptidase domain-containing protein [Actinomadura hallensis]TQM68664.1 putative serine protease PepD [Actinomadura hallensis]
MSYPPQADSRYGMGDGTSEYDLRDLVRYGLGDPHGPDFTSAPLPRTWPQDDPFTRAPQADPWALPDHRSPGYGTPGHGGPGYGEPRRGRGSGRAVVVSAVVAALLAGGLAGGVAGRVTAAAPASTALQQSDAGPVNGGSGDLSDVAARVQASVVSIEVRSAASQGTGSGFVIDRRGHILTNAHVVEDDGQVTVVLADQRRVQARLVGTDRALDLAVLAIPAAQAPAPLTFSRFSDVRVGDPVIALGSPLGLQGTVTSGIVSALNRQVRLGEGGGASTAVQTDASINPGNSGGPLVNARGEVIGVNTAIATLMRGGGGGSIGIGFAIPADRAREGALRLLR